MSGSRERTFTTDDARRIGEQIGVDWSQAPFDVEQLRIGMEVELEHELHDLLTNVTDNDPIVTAKIALAHLNEFADYYTRLERMEAKRLSRVRSSIAKTGIATTFASTGVLLLGAALMVAFLLRPPLLGWVGFAVVCAIVFALTTVAAFAFPRMRVSPVQPAATLDGEKRLLVVADEHCGSPGLWKAIDARLAGAVAVHLVVPVRVSHLHYWTNDESRESHDAEDRARLAVGLLSQPDVSVTGGVGSDDPLESIADALGAFPATHVLLATSTEQDSYWMEQGLLAKARVLRSRSATSSSHRRHPLNPTTRTEKRRSEMKALVYHGPERKHGSPFPTRRSSSRRTCRPDRLIHDLRYRLARPQGRRP